MQSVCNWCYGKRNANAVLRLYRKLRGFQVHSVWYGGYGKRNASKGIRFFIQETTLFPSAQCVLRVTTEMQIKCYTYTGEDLVSNHTVCAMTSEVQF